MHTHTPQIYQGHTPQICQGHTLPPNIPGTHTPNTPGAHTHTSNIARTNIHIHRHPPNIPGRQTATPPTPATQPFTPVPASRRGWGVGRPRGDAGGSSTRPLALSLERKRVTAWSGGPVVPSQAMPWEGLLPQSRDVLISFCRQRKWRRGT